MNGSESPVSSQPPILRPAPPPVLLPTADPEQAPGPLNRSRWRIHLMLMAAYPVVLGLVGWSSRLEGPTGPALSHGTRGLLAVCGTELGIFGVVFGLAWLASRATRDDLLLRWRGGWLTVPIGVGYSVVLRLGILVAAVIVVIIALATRLITLDSLEHFALANRPNVQALVDIPALRNNLAYYWLTLTLVSFVVAGLREELWRSACIGGLRRLWPGLFGSRVGQLAAVGVAAVLFGLGHLPQGPIAVCLTALLGLGLGTIMVLHRSIWPAVLAHGMFDATTLAALPLIMDKLPQLR